MSTLTKQWRSEAKRPGARIKKQKLKKNKKNGWNIDFQNWLEVFFINKANSKIRKNKLTPGFNIRNYLIGCLGVLSICFFVFAYQEYMPILKKVFLIESVAITGELVNTNGSEIEIAIEQLVESDYFSIRLGAIKTVLEDLPWIKTVDVRRVWPNSILININEKQAVAYWQNKELLSSDAKSFNPKEIKSIGHLPRLSGPEDKAEFVMNNYHQMNRILRAVGLNIESLYLEDRYSWQLILNNKMTVRVDVKKSLEKIKNMVSLLKRVSIEELEEIKSIDLRYENGMAISHSHKKLAG